MQRKLSKDAKITLSILLCLIGLILLSSNYFLTIKSNLFNEKNIRLLEQQILITESIEEISKEDFDNLNVDAEDQISKGVDDYIGYLEIPEIDLKRGFVSLDSKYNSVGYNVTVISGSSMPDIDKGNLILAAHRGNSAVSFFDKLYKLSNDAHAYVTYNGKKYDYKLVSRYYEDKDGVLTIKRNADVTSLTLITCTRNDKATQTVFVFELVSVK